MEDRTFAYLTGRFRDYYRHTEVELPPEIDAREWGYIPWKRDGGTVMIRHKSLLEIGNVDDFLPSEHPRHIYTSASTYEDPGAGTMDEKRWIASDLIFDIDIDEGHLPDYIDKDRELTYAEELELAKTHLLRLLDVLEDDFGFENLEVVFSGGRGYHVHVRDPHVRSLTSKHRTELVSYIQGVNLDLDALVQEKTTTIGSRAGKGGLGFKPDGGWSTRVHKRIVEVMDETLELVDQHHGVTDEAQLNLIDKFEGIGETNASAVITTFQENNMAIRAGHVNPHSALKKLAKAITKEVHQNTYADIDEPVTTDINRLIRLPGSLHGRSGLRVTRIPRDEIEQFDPLVDAVPETFKGQDITVRVTEPTSVSMIGEEFEFDEGKQRVPEAVGLYLMAQGMAEKERE